MTETELRKLIVKIAIYYYQENMNQAQIAKNIDISRPMISSYLQKAKASRSVNIYINDKNYHVAQMESKIEKQFNLKKVIITQSLELSKDEVLLAVVRSSINYLKRNLEDKKNVGISWGNTLRVLAREFPYESLNHLNLVPLIGGMGNQYISYHSNQICYDLRNKFQCKSNFLYSPALIKENKFLNIIKQNDSIKEIMQKGKQVDMALVGISTPYINNIMKEVGFFSENDSEEASRLKGIGDINSRIFDESGREIDCSINRSVVGITLEDIKKIPHVVGIASGQEKQKSILTAVKAGMVDVLIT